MLLKSLITGVLIRANGWGLDICVLGRLVKIGANYD